MADEARDALAASHSAEHILSAVMRRKYGSPHPLETHLGARKSKCDFRVPHPLEADALCAIEAAVNDEIAADHLVRKECIPVDVARGRFDLSRVPDGPDRIRIVSIGDLDQTPCAGEHVERTSQIGRFEIAGAEMKSENRIRIRFRLHDPVQGAA